MSRDKKKNQQILISIPDFKQYYIKQKNAKNLFIESEESKKFYNKIKKDLSVPLELYKEPITL